MSAIISIKKPNKNNPKPKYKYPFNTTPVSVESAVSAHRLHIETHIPCNDHAKKNLVGETLISLNLLSSPAFFILKKRKLPSLTAQQIIAIPKIKFVKFSEESYKMYETANI